MLNIEINSKVLTAVAKYINAENEAIKADFPVISADNLQESKVRGNNIVTLADGGIKGLAKHTILYDDLDLRKAGRPKKEKDEKYEKLEE